jgi:hypothetical protein
MPTAQMAALMRFVKELQLLKIAPRERFSMNVQFELSLADFLAAQRLHSKRSLWSRFVYILTRWIYPTLGVCFLLMEPIVVRDATHQFLVVPFICGLILVLCPVYLHLQMRRCYNRTRSDPGQCAVGFDEDSLQVSGVNSKSELNWKAIHTFRENRKVFLLYLAPARFIAIPKRVFSEEQIEELRSLLLRKIPSATG